MINYFISSLFLKLRRLVYGGFSNNKNVKGSFRALQPVVIRGLGSIVFRENIKFGVLNSPFLYSTYTYLEARNKESKIEIGDNVNCNNGLSITSEKSIVIKNNVLIGYNCQISDSNFHNLHPDRRRETDASAAEIVIEQNVFIGNNVTILKGVVIGENSVVAAGSIVTKKFPSNVIIGGIPASVIKSIDL